MAETITHSARSWKYDSGATAVATPVTVELPDYVDGFTYTINTDVAGTGGVVVSGSVSGSTNVVLGDGATDFDVAAIVVKSYANKLASVTFTPTIATATTYTVFVMGHKHD